MFFTLNSDKKIIQIIKQSLPSVVGIFALKPTNSPSPNNSIVKIKNEYFEKIGNSSGFIVDKIGLVATNYHPISNRKLTYKMLWNNNFYDCSLFYYNDINDIAVLKLQKPDKKPLPIIKLGDAANIVLGETVVSIGNVLDEFDNTVSKGIISGLSRYVKADSNYKGVLEYKGLIQTDAAINPGNSGGPLINAKGEVIGITTLAVSGVENIGLAIPINPVKKIIKDLKLFGAVKQVSLGVRYILVDDNIKTKYNLPINYGAFIIYGSTQPSILENSLAKRYGIQEGDIILSLDNYRVDSKHPIDEFLKDICIGDSIKVKVLRDKKEIIIKIIFN
jgi:serine protease Do